MTRTVELEKVNFAVVPLVSNASVSTPEHFTNEMLVFMKVRTYVFNIFDYQ